VATGAAGRDDVAAALDHTDATRPRRVLCLAARGAGKSWWLDHAAGDATQRGHTVARTAGRLSQRDMALSGLAALFGSLDGHPSAGAADVDALRRMIDDAPTTDPGTVKLATLRALTAVADHAPLCVAVDDIDLLDSSSREVLDAALAACAGDPVVLIATAESSLVAADRVVRLAPLDERVIVTLLQERGLAPAAATRCARAAGGNPGVALAMAEALNDRQRAGSEPVPDLPRLGGALAAELQTRMRSLGDSCCRALVVAAAVAGGDAGAAADALRRLGEPGLEALEPAEEAGLVELVGATVVFPDLFVRHAAYHLLAPASRRAAHRALASSFDEPHQAANRVWHLVGAANGPSDELATALALLASDSSRRGAVSTAAHTYERAVEFAASTAVREEVLEGAIRAALDNGDLGRAAHLVEGLAPQSDAMRTAIAEVHELSTGRARGVRSPTWSAARGGDHRAVLSGLGDTPTSPFDAVPVAVALRHDGRTREARDLLARSDSAAALPTSFIAAWYRVVEADLEQLAGRPLAGSLDVPPSAPEWLRTQASAVAAIDLTTSPATATAAFTDEGEGVLGRVRAAVRTAVSTGDLDALAGAIDMAQEERLPVEAGEARVWQAELERASGRGDGADAVRLALATLQRCGVRAWDGRCAAVTAQPATPVRAVDPAINALSQSERRVADAVAAGLTNREVAAQLFLSVKTVDFHLQQIYRKLAIRSRTELAVRMAGIAPTVGRA